MLVLAINYQWTITLNEKDYTIILQDFRGNYVLCFQGKYKEIKQTSKLDFFLRFQVYEQVEDVSKDPDN